MSTLEGGVVAKNAPLGSSTSLECIDRLQAAEGLNIKLKRLLQHLQRNITSKKLELESRLEQDDERCIVVELKKKNNSLSADIRKITHSLNLLMNQNSKFKLQVDGSRNSRVIYSNVYKNIEKEIRKTEYVYKCCLIENLACQEAYIKMQDKMDKVIKKLQKDIELFERKATAETSRSRVVQSNLREEKLAEQIQMEQIQTRLNSSSDREAFLRQQKKQRINEQIQEAFEHEVKANYYDSVVKKLKQMTGSTKMEEILDLWEHVDEMNEKVYEEYVDKQESLRMLEAEEDLLKEQLAHTLLKEECNELQSRKMLTVNEEEQELALVEEEIERERDLLRENEEKMSVLMDINCSVLCSQDLRSYIERVTHVRSNEKQQLDKMLEQIQKQKIVDSYVLLPNQYKKIRVY